MLYFYVIFLCHISPFIGVSDCCGSNEKFKGLQSVFGKACFTRAAQTQGREYLVLHDEIKKLKNGILILKEDCLKLSELYLVEGQNTAILNERRAKLLQFGTKGLQFRTKREKCDQETWIFPGRYEIQQVQRCTSNRPKGCTIAEDQFGLYLASTLLNPKVSPN